MYNPSKLDRKEWCSLTVAKNIKVYLVEMDIKQAWLSKQIGMDTDKLCQALNDKRKLDTEEFAKILSVLKVPAERFIHVDSA